MGDNSKTDDWRDRDWPAPPYTLTEANGRSVRRKLDRIYGALLHIYGALIVICLMLGGIWAAVVAHA